MGIVSTLKVKVSQFLAKGVRLVLKEIVKQSAKQSDPPNIWVHLWQKAANETADYVEKNMLTAPYYDSDPQLSHPQLLELALSKVQIDGLNLEFGTGWKAKSINFLAERIKGTLHGFDSFEGLPEPWFGKLGKGTFSTNGQLPIVRENVKLHPGWFDKTLPKFAATYEGQIAFMHIDCDLYSSTKIVFDILGDRISSGTVIQFDEYFNYPGWRNHEYKAFQEFVDNRGVKYEYLGYCASGFAVAVIIL